MRRLRVREYSWLDNPLTHKKYKVKTPFVVRAGDVKHPKHEQREHILPAKFKDFELVGELHRLKHQPIIHVPNPDKLYGGFTHPHIQQEFDKALSKVAITWCCLPDSVIKARNLTDGKHPYELKP